MLVTFAPPCASLSFGGLKTILHWPAPAAIGSQKAARGACVFSLE
jgi:hypothetical protein